MMSFSYYAKSSKILNKCTYRPIWSEFCADPYIEKKLSLSEGYLSSGEVGIYHIPSQPGLNVKIPSGNEGGANSQWLIGGKTTNGLIEGIADLKNPNLRYEEIKIDK